MSAPEHTSTVRGVVFRVVVVVVLFTPAALIPFTPLSPVTAVFVAGSLPVAIAWALSPRYALTAIPVSAVLNALAVLVYSHPLLTGVFMLGAAVLVGLSAFRGLHLVAALAALQPSITVIAGPGSVSFADWTPGSVGQAALAGLVAVLGGLWAALVAAIALRGNYSEDASSPPEPVATPVVLLYTAALALTLGPLAFVASTWFLQSTAGWLLTTVLLVARPANHESRTLIGERTLGALAGGFGAVVVAVAAPNADIRLLIGIAAIVTAAVLQLQHARYAYFASFATAAAVLLNARSGSVLQVGVERIGLTVAGVVVVGAAVAVAEQAFSRYSARS